MGVGLSLGQRAVSAVFGPPTVATTPTAPIQVYPPCPEYTEVKRAMDSCLKEQSSMDNCSKQIKEFQACIDSKGKS